MQLQHEQYKRTHGIPMSPEQATNTAGILAALEGLYFEDTASVERFADPGYWETLADHRLHCSHSIAAELVAARAAVPDPVARGRAAAREQLSESGFAVLTAAEGGHPAGLFDAVQHTMQQLRAAGWPAAFIFLYDEIWVHVIDPLFATFAGLLGDGVWMEPDLNAWALSSEAGHHVGQNFAGAHRDMNYLSCHGRAGEELSLNAWVPLNPAGATLANGCMRVVPIAEDPYFFSQSHPYYNNSTAAMAFMDDPDESTVALVANAGDLCTWSPSLVHWGESCTRGHLEPRISIAATFRAHSAGRSSYQKPPAHEDGGAGGGGGCVQGDPTGASSDGPPPISREQLVSAATIPRRLAYVAKALISFAHHYPGFPGLSAAQLRAGTAAPPGTGGADRLSR